MAKAQSAGSVDEAVLRQLLADTSAGMFRELLASCRTELPTLLAAASRAAAGGDLETLRREAHSVKGIALTFGMILLSEPAEAIEAACAAGQTEPARRLTALLGERLPAALIDLGRSVEALRGGRP